MRNPLDDHQASHTLRKVIAAKNYNLVRLALLRFENPLRAELSGMRCLDIILSNQYWLCVDPCMEDRPVMAWTDFETTGRAAIHAPVSCMLRLYHVHAGLIMGEAMEALERTLHQQLESG